LKSLQCMDGARMQELKMASVFYSHGILFSLS
jgi:hypothetical protein